MSPNVRCPHVVAVGFCTICLGLPLAAPHLETHPETVVAIIGSNQPIPEPDKPEERADGMFFQQPIQSFVSTTSSRPSEKTIALFNLLPLKLK